jgi:integrase
MDKRAWPTGVRPSGRGLQIRIFRNREILFQETIQCDPYSARDLKAAVKRRASILARLANGLSALPDERGTVATVADICQDLLDTLDAKDSTHIGYERIFNRYWLPVIGHWPAAEVTDNKVKEILTNLKKMTRDGSAPVAALSSKTKRNILGPLSEAYQNAHITPNPCEGIKIRKGQKKPVERYKPDERERLLNALSDPEDRLYFALLFGGGLRPCGEPLALTWPDWDGEEMNIDKQMTRRKLELTTKTSQVRKTYIPTWVRPMLKNHSTRFEGGYIFQNTFGRPHLDSDKFNAAWKEAHKKCRIPYRDPYKCRHTRASELLSQGIDPGDAAKQMGHSVEMFLRIYSSFIEEFAKNKDKKRFEGVAPVLAKPLAN